VADTKISALTALTGANLATDDEFPLSDTDATTTKAITAAELTIGLPITDTNSIITATKLNAALQEAFQGAFSVNVVATSGATETLTVQPAHKVTMDQNCTLTFMTPPTVGFSFLLHLLGAFTPTFPGSVDWDAGAAPTYADDSVYGFWTDDTGTTWYGSLIASALA
jgi:Flp pilus assembly protein TadG